MRDTLIRNFLPEVRGTGRNLIRAFPTEVVAKLIPIDKIRGVNKELERQFTDCFTKTRNLKFLRGIVNMPWDEVLCAFSDNSHSDVSNAFLNGQLNYYTVDSRLDIVAVEITDDPTNDEEIHKIVTCLRYFSDKIVIRVATRKGLSERLTTLDNILHEGQRNLRDVVILMLDNRDIYDFVPNETYKVLKG